MHIRPFEIALIAFFVIAAIVGLIVASNYSGDNSEDLPYGESVIVWGTLDRVTMSRVLRTLSNTNKGLDAVQYIEKDPRTFDFELINAIAEGRSPDLIILPHTKLVTHRTKLQPISYETIQERTFRDRYIDGAEIFMRDDGIYGIPFAVDPLVMYWNRDIFSTSGLSQPPKTWETLLSETVGAITRVNEQRAVTRSAIAFGEYSNVQNAKEILSMLFLQAGSTMVNESMGVYRVTLDTSQQGALDPADAVLNFYTQFALSNKALYSWNRSMELDRREFLSGDLGLYFGLGSEYSELERDNVNLNFDIAPVPQDSGATILRNYADFYAFAIPRAARNITGAFGVAQYLASETPAQEIINAYGFAPALRSLHSGAQGDPVKNVTYSEALISRGWLDPNPSESDKVFQRMIERLTSGQTRVNSAVSDAIQELEALF